MADDKKQMAMKYFDYAEQPIKDLIFRYIKQVSGDNINIKDVFCDYKEEKDIISVEDKGKYYMLEIDTRHKINSIEAEKLTNCDNVQKAISILYQSIFTVYMPVVQTMDEKYRKILHAVFPRPDKLYFQLECINHLKEEKEYILQRMNELMNRPKENKLNIITALNQYAEHLSNIKDSEIEKLGSECNEKNKQLLNYKLWINISEERKFSNEQIMSRLPVIGELYEEPDE